MTETDPRLQLGREPHKFHSPFKVNAGKNYPFVHKTERGRRRSRRFRAFVCKIAPPILRWFLGLEIVGRENLAALEGGAVSVCNHVHSLDCVALACAFWDRDTYYLSLKENFGIPLIRHLIKALNAVPIPDGVSGYAAMLRQLKPRIKEGGIFQIYPEGSLRPDCTVLRDFMPGAFEIAAIFDVPVVPCAIRLFREDGKTRRVLTVGAPIEPNRELHKKLRAQELETSAREAMLEALEGCKRQPL